MENLNEPEYKARCKSAVQDLIKFGAHEFPELYAADAAGALIVAGIQVGQRAGLDLHIAKTLRLLADKLDSEIN